MGLILGLLLMSGLGCGNPAPTLRPSATATVVAPSPSAARPTPTDIPTPVPSISPTSTPTTPLTRVQFALDISETGELVFPATEFLYGVTRMYVGFAYQDLGAVTEATSAWYLNDNLVVSDTLDWDGGDEGYYVIWMEDPNGLGRGEWRWELRVVDRIDAPVEDDLLGSGTFVIDGEPGYVNEEWGVSFDPPLGWGLESEGQGFVAFASPNRQAVLILRVLPTGAGLTETVAANLALFQEDHPEAELSGTETVTMNGAEARLQEIHFVDQEGNDQLLYLVSSVRADWAYSLWMLGTASQEAALRTLLTVSLRSVRFLAE